MVRRRFRTQKSGWALITSNPSTLLDFNGAPLWDM